MILALHNYFSGNDNSRRCMFGGLHENRCFALAQLFPSLIKPGCINSSFNSGMDLNLVHSRISTSNLHALIVVA